MYLATQGILSMKSVTRSRNKKGRRDFSSLDHNFTLRHGADSFHIFGSSSARPMELPPSKGQVSMCNLLTCHRPQLLTEEWLQDLPGNCSTLPSPLPQVMCNRWDLAHRAILASSNIFAHSLQISNLTSLDCRKRAPPKAWPTNMAFCDFRQGATKAKLELSCGATCSSPLQRPPRNRFSCSDSTFLLCTGIHAACWCGFNILSGKLGSS